MDASALRYSCYALSLHGVRVINTRVGSLPGTAFDINIRVGSLPGTAVDINTRVESLPGTAVDFNARIGS
jgi:hypothetical protein